MDAANVAGFTWSMERFRGYFPLGQRKYDFSGGQTLTFFIKIQYFHWDKKKIQKDFFIYFQLCFKYLLLSENLFIQQRSTLLSAKELQR